VRYEKERDIVIKFLHNLNNNFVLLRYYNNYNSTTILLLFEFALVDVLETIYNVLFKQQKQFKRDKVLIYLLID